MAEYETEEQQVEAIKEWWKENGTAVLLGAALGIGALGGWRFWASHQETLAEEASDLYIVMQEAILKSDASAIESQAQTLRDNYKSTPYASLATLYEAKLQSVKGNLDVAEENLNWVMNNSSQQSVKNIARIRLARVLLAGNKLDEAASLLNYQLPEAFSSLVNEIKGDIFVAKGDIEQAKKAYDDALQSADASGVEYLELKRNNLGS